MIKSHPFTLQAFYQGGDPLRGPPSAKVSGNLLLFVGDYGCPLSASGDVKIRPPLGHLNRSRLFHAPPVTGEGDGEHSHPCGT